MSKSRDMSAHSPDKLAVWVYDGGELDVKPAG